MPAKKSSKSKGKKNLSPRPLPKDEASSVKGGALNAYLPLEGTKAPKPEGGSSGGAGSSGSW